jgi:putative redox protein
MQSIAVWVGENRFEVATPNGSFFIGPKPGEPDNPSSVEYLAASLAGCVGYFVAKFLGRRGVEPKGLKVSVAGTMAESPHRIGSFDIVVDLPKGLAPELQEVARRAAETCTIHHTLQHPPKMTFTYNFPA